MPTKRAKVVAADTHGGERKGAGRPATGSKQVGVTLDPATVDKARQIGEGNVSEGLRRAVAAFNVGKNKSTELCMFENGKEEKCT